MSKNVRAHIFISGRVQGGFFRENTSKKAQKLGLLGWVKNLDNGKVEAVFEGDKEKVEKLVKWAKRGPMFAKVDNIDIDWQEYTGEFQNFEIRYQKII